MLSTSSFIPRPNSRNGVKPETAKSRHASCQLIGTGYFVWTPTVRSYATMLTDQFILLAEDDPNDTLLIKRAFQKAGLGDILKTVGDGDEAIKYLNGVDAYSDRSR